VRWCADGEFLAIFLGPAFPASCVQHISDLHSKFALGATPCVEVGETSNLRPLRIGKEKKKKKQDQNIMSTSSKQGGHNDQRPTSIIPHFYIGYHPAATLAIYSGLGQAPNILASISSGLVKKNTQKTHKT